MLSSVAAQAKKPPASFPIYADSRLVAFEGITWGMRKDEAIQAASDNGWKLETGMLRSRVNGVRLAAFFTYDRYGNLVAIRAEHMARIGHSAYLESYQTLFSMLVDTYGKPDATQAPYSVADLPFETWTRADGSIVTAGVRLRDGNVGVWFSYRSPQYLRYTLENSLDFKTELAPWAP